MAACQDTSPANNETADDYAARLNGGPAQPVQAEPTGQVVPPRPTPKPTPTPSWADGMLTADMAHCDADTNSIWMAACLSQTGHGIQQLCEKEDILHQNFKIIA